MGKIRKAVEKNQNLRSWRYMISPISRRRCRLDIGGTKISSYISATYWERVSWRHALELTELQ
jgi:hypothetical protein